MEICKKSGPTFFYIIGLCGLLAGTVSAFLLKTASSDTSAAPGEWGQWEVLQAHPKCFLIRERNCSSEDCKKEYKYCDEVAHWGTWSESQCKFEGNTCFIARTRNCSVQALVDCNSNETNQILFVVDGNKTCPCEKDSNKPINVTGVVMWNLWSSWECNTDQIPCVRYRYRSCSDGISHDCTKQGGIGYELVQCDGTCTDNTTGSTASQIITTAQVVTSEMSTTTSAPSTFSISTNSSSEPNEGGSITSTLPHPFNSTPSTEYVPIYWLEWSGWECDIDTSPCFMAHTRNCSTFDVDECKRELGGKHYEVELCNSSVCPANWMEWGQWKCKMGNHGVCEMIRTRDCSTGANEHCGNESISTLPCNNTVCPDKVTLQDSGQCSDYSGSTCSDDSTCGVITNIFHPVCSFHDTASKSCQKACGCCEEEPYWLDWSAWECNVQTGSNDKCKMRRTRNCSISDECIGMSVILAKCSDNICPEIPHWLEWSVWKCSLAPNRTCEMSRTRNCSTDTLDDCEGDPAEKTTCSKEECPDEVEVSKVVNCTGFDPQTTNCSDHPGCHLFSEESALNLICVEYRMAPECPLTCGCCVVVPTTTPMPTEETTLTAASSTTGSGVDGNDNSTGSTTSNSTISGGDINTSTTYTTTPYTEDNTTTSSMYTEESTITSPNPTATPGPTGVDSNKTSVTTTTIGGEGGNTTPTNNVTSGNATGVGGNTTPTNNATSSNTTGVGGNTTPTNNATSSNTTGVGGNTTPTNNATSSNTTGVGGNTTPTNNATSSNTTGVGGNSTPTNNATSSNTTGVGGNTTPTNNATSSNTTGVGGNTTPTNNTTSSYTTGVSSTGSSLSTPSTISTFITTMQTTTPTPVKTTTHKQPYTIPPVPITCKVCAGPEFLCEKLYMDKQCDPPNNYCINKLGNHKDGSRMVIRSCGTFDTCYRDWFLGSSDSDKCRKFEDNNIITLDFDCTYCCVNDFCNEPIRPTDATLYKDL